MLSERIIRMVEQAAHRLTKAWMETVRNDPRFIAFHDLDPALLYQRCFAVYSQLSEWLDHRTNVSKLRTHYMALGEQRFHEGIPLSEVVHALIITRRQLYIFMDEEGYLHHDPFVVQQSIELSNRVIVFFDRCTYFTIRGYEAAMLDELEPCRSCGPGYKKLKRAVTHLSPWEAVRQGGKGNA